MKYAVRYRGGIEHYDDVLDALPAARAGDHLRRARAQREYLRELGFVDREIEDLEAEVRRER